MQPPVCVCVCLCQSTYMRVNLCNCGCPFKGPSQICPRPFDQTFCDSPALDGPRDGRVRAGWDSVLVGHGWDRGFDPHTHTHTDKQNKRAASFKCDTSRPQSELKRRSIGQCRCLCTNVCVPMPVCVFVSQNVITRLEMTSKNKPLYMVSKLGRLRLTVALKYCHTTSSVCAYLYFSVLNTAAVW